MTTHDQVRIGLRCPECKHEFKWAMSPTEAVEQASMLTAAAQFDPKHPLSLPPIDGRKFGVKGDSDGHAR